MYKKWKENHFEKISRTKFALAVSSYRETCIKRLISRATVLNSYASQNMRVGTMRAKLENGTSSYMLTGLRVNDADKMKHAWNIIPTAKFGKKNARMLITAIVSSRRDYNREFDLWTPVLYTSLIWVYETTLVTSSRQITKSSEFRK